MREDDFELTFDLAPPAEDHEPSAAASAEPAPAAEAPKGGWQRWDPCSR